MTELICPPVIKFMEEFERYEPAARDSTSQTTFKHCPRKYFYRIVLGFAERVTRHYFKFGGSYHKFMELLERSYYNPLTNEGNQDFEDKTHMEAGLAGAVKMFGKKDPPVGSQYDFLTLGKLIQSCGLAYKKWQNEKKAGVFKVIGIEQPFEVVLKDGKTRRGGKADVFGMWHSQPACKDFKTTTWDPSGFRRGIDPNDQFDGYLLGMSKLYGDFVSTLLVDALFNKKPTKKDPSPNPKIEIFTVNKTKWQLNQFENECIYWEEMIDVCRRDDVWPKNEKGCFRCEYRSVCTKGTERAMIAQLKSEFTVSPWDYKTLGEEK